ncbi:MAG: hypothetical protein ACE5MM_03540 [Nitrospiraceae bacterium]
MFRLMLGFFAGLVLGRNCSKLALKGSHVLRRLADRLEVLEHGRAHAGPVEGEKHVTFKPAA